MIKKQALIAVIEQLQDEKVLDQIQALLAQAKAETSAADAPTPGTTNTPASEQE